MEHPARAPSPVSTTSGDRLKEKRGACQRIEPGSYDATLTHYPRVCNAAQHPTVAQFMGMGRSALIARYCALHPEVSEAALSAILRREPRHFRWAGCDLFVVGPQRRAVVVETNSCPSGQKSLPFVDGDELNGYGRLARSAFRSLLPGSSGALGGPERGVLAVVFDKNSMEAAGYAAALAELSGEAVFLAEHYLTDPDPPVRWDCANRLHVRPDAAAADAWLPVRAALRYVTQKPWTRMPVTPATPLLNPLLPCLAGGRNKMLAARAYDALNARLEAEGSALRLRTPATIGDVHKAQVPELVQRMGGCAVVKVPYGNAGQGVYTITSARELTDFMAEKQGYDKFIVQQLVGGRRWGEVATSEAGAAAAAEAAEAAAYADGGSGAGAEVAAAPPVPLPPCERAYHLGTVPNARGKTYVFDLRMMLTADETGFKPCSLYARRAAAPLSEFPPSDYANGEPAGGDRSHRSSVSSVESLAALGYGPPTSSGAARLPLPGAKAASASWAQLGTNLSVLTGDLTWSTESERLVMCDARDFAVLGLGIDDLIDAYVQSALAVTAIDEQASTLLNPDGTFSLDKFAAVNDDPALLAELMPQANGR